MRETMIKLSAAIGVVAKAALWLSGAGLVLMTVLIAWQVWGRFVLNDTPTVTEVSSVLVMGWFILLGAAVGLREGNHLSFDILLYVMPRRVCLIFHSISDIVVLVFSLGMVVYGVQLAARTWQNTVPLLGISGGIEYFALIAGGVLMALFAVERLLRRAVGLPTRRFGDDPVDEETA
ncbi:TRAP transporter small permease [Roseobacter sp. HKCCA0434]|uniref:TRAP transporter small permease n=1 Tax=Roseobacter sp. HKCCA0434 TaxID=3079297 RepID=UPI002905E593|nr:TRAP transporter small permease [Roseobacter sp. HKCCA0434]